MRQFGAAAVFWIAASIPVLAQPVFDAALDMKAKRARAEFACAILAAEGPAVLHGLASPLAQQAHEGYLPVAEAVLPAIKGENNGPLSAYIATVDAQYVVAMAFGEAVQSINRLLDEKHPFGTPGSSYETTKMMRELVAGSEFGSRNCELLLP